MYHPLYVYIDMMRVYKNHREEYSKYSVNVTV